MATTDHALEKLRRRAAEIIVDGEFASLSSADLEQMIARREVELMASGNALYKPIKSPSCYGDLYDPTAEDIVNGVPVKSCVVCSYARSCGAVVRQRFGSAPGDRIVTEPDGADPVDHEAKKKLDKAALAATKPKRVPPYAQRPKDEVTGITSGTKINTVALCLLRGGMTRDEIVTEVISKHGGSISSNRNTVMVAIWDIRANRYPQLGKDVVEDDQHRYQLTRAQAS